MAIKKSKTTEIAKTTKTAKTTGTAMVAWKERFADLAKTANQGLETNTGRKFISLANGVMRIGEDEIPGNKLRCIIIASIRENSYYDPDVPYNPRETTTPICFAFGRDKNEMAPDQPEVPERQSDKCISCEWNKYKTAKTGDGKACKNVMRLALIHEDDLEDLENAEVVYMKLPVTSVKNFEKYALDTLYKRIEMTYPFVISTVKLVKDTDTQFKVVFELGEGDIIEDPALWDDIEDQHQKNMDNINFPYIQKERTAPAKPNKPVAKQKFARR